jgi:hypothetical protein
MEMQANHIYGGKRVLLLPAIFILSLLLWICPAEAALFITDMSLQVNPGQIYTGPEEGTDPGEFQLLYEDALTPLTDEFPITSGDLKINNTPQVLYQLQNAWLKMTPSLLTSDNSGGTGFANGDFAAGAEITIWGTIVEKASGTPVFTDGLILTATVTDDFNLKEDSGGFLPIPNRITGLQMLDVTGGELASHGVSGLKIYDDDDLFRSDYDLFNCQQLDNLGGAVEDFQSMIANGAGTVAFTAEIPEPITAALFGLGSIFLLRRRR